MFNALLLTQQDKTTHATVTQINDDQLPAGNVTVAVNYSSLNYKDGLAITGKGKIIREFPMVPGIDFAGTVLESADARYQVGDAVVLTGWGVGENHWGGHGAKSAIKCRLVGEIATRLNQPASHDDWYCRLYRHVVCTGAD